ncbi:3'-5' exonuclease [Streptomyces sp. B1866]|uniref:3'-5' exonuclease n=1 Tax=Streptomyces sp. B1866 TaxID=3075431 RepID=UPI00288D87D2|nr:3'-5' exonuclease [Streptomyces sp. B1866]MDT3400242.1 3'-5' exonuclease [Streptomyces sp. B1866]
MPRWFEGPLAALDARATGADTERDRVVSAAFVIQREPDGVAECRRWLVSPGVPVPESAAEAHGLTEDHLRRHGRWPAPVMQEVGQGLAESAASGIPLVVMDAPFDLTLLDRELRRHRNSSLTAALSGSPLRVLDPQVLDRHLDRYRKGRRTLADLCARYGVEQARTRDTAADALAALKVVRALGRRFASRLEALSPAELHERQTEWYAAQARGLQAWFARDGSDEHLNPSWPLRPGLPAVA